ncbi:MAG: hypothetical protein PUK75_08930 [bacterium]|nr:hypothetical protein [bacterium]MDY4100198.1 hypothetical protein [Lachnospiraceae bacterium]
MTDLNKKKSLLGIVLLAGAVILGGCGEEPYELQDNEREIIVNYAAHIVSKYNVHQPEGYRYVFVPADAEAFKEEDQTQEPQPEETDENGQQPEDQVQADGDEAGDDAEAAGTEEQESATLSEALGLKGIQAVYTGAELTDQYQSIIPESGKKLLILHVTLQNPTGKAKKCDILSLLPMFRAKVNGTHEVTSELTILEENLSTWEKKIPAGGSEDTIILFQVKEDEVTAVEQLELKVTVGEKTSKVIFL